MMSSYTPKILAIPDWYVNFLFILYYNIKLYVPINADLCWGLSIEKKNLQYKTFGLILFYNIWFVFSLSVLTTVNGCEMVISCQPEYEPSKTLSVLFATLKQDKTPKIMLLWWLLQGKNSLKDIYQNSQLTKINWPTHYILVFHFWSAQSRWLVFSACMSPVVFFLEHQAVIKKINKYKNRCLDKYTWMH